MPQLPSFSASAATPTNQNPITPTSAALAAMKAAHEDGEMAAILKLPTGWQYIRMQNHTIAWRGSLAAVQQQSSGDLEKDSAAALAP